MAKAGSVVVDEAFFGLLVRMVLVGFFSVSNISKELVIVVEHAVVYEGGCCFVLVNTSGLVDKSKVDFIFYQVAKQVDSVDGGVTAVHGRVDGYCSVDSEAQAENARRAAFGG